MNDSVVRMPARLLKEQFSRVSDAWKEHSDPIFRFWAEGDWWGFPFFSLSASRYFGDKETLCLYWSLGTVIIKGPRPKGSEIFIDHSAPVANHAEAADTTTNAGDTMTVASESKVLKSG